MGEMHKREGIYLCSGLKQLPVVWQVKEVFLSVGKLLPFLVIFKYVFRWSIISGKYLALLRMGIIYKAYVIMFLWNSS